LKYGSDIYFEYIIGFAAKGIAMTTTTKSSAIKRKTLLFKFKDDTVTTVSHETFSEIARTLGFNETQTLHLAIARLRDELLAGGQRGSAVGEEPYPPLTAGQLFDIRARAPKSRGKLVRKESAGRKKPKS
jgi:hypothetical protein